VTRRYLSHHAGGDVAGDVARRVRSLALALAAVALVAAAPSAARAAPRIGIADSDSSTFVDSNWPGLGVRLGRAVVPYDVALTQPVAGTPAGNRRIEFDAWVANAQSAGVSPMVAFQASLGPNQAAPSPTRYRRAIRAFLGTYPTVRTLAPWNEPNFRSAGANPLVHKPRLAAAYYRVLRDACARCTVAAGELASIPGDPYLARYTRALGSVRPRLWTVHAHTDANRFQDGSDTSAPATRSFLEQIRGRSKIWIDEVGAYYRDEDGRVWGDASQTHTASFVLGLGTLSRRIARIYYYNLSNECSDPSLCAVQDRGLVAPKPFDLPPGASIGYDLAGRVRPAYAVIANRGPVTRPTG
jgi:hypothetical protein